MTSEPARREVVRYGALLYSKGLTVGTAGNISMRSAKDMMVITPSGSCKGLLKEDQLVTVRISDGAIMNGGRPSIETPFHLAFYRTRPEVNAVVHTHPINCTALAVMGMKVIPALTPEGLLVLGRDVPMVPYATPGTDDLANVLKDSMRTSDAFILEKHGAITVGSTMKEAFHRMETLEFIAQLQVSTLLLGGAGSLPDREVDRILHK